MGSTYRTHEEKDKSIRGFGVGRRRKEIAWKNQVWMVENITMNLKETGCESAALIATVQGGYKWRILVKTVMNVWVI